MEFRFSDAEAAVERELAARALMAVGLALLGVARQTNGEFPNDEDGLREFTDIAQPILAAGMLDISCQPVSSVDAEGLAGDQDDPPDVWVTLGPNGTLELIGNYSQGRHLSVTIRADGTVVEVGFGAFG